MSERPSLVLLTTVAPDPENRGGPSGLPWEMLQELEQAGWQVHVQVVPLARTRLARRLMQLALPLAQIPVEHTEADAYIAYPSYLSRFVPLALRSRTLVLGPDASSMLYARFARIESGRRRWLSLALCRWFAWHERWTARHFAGIVVVGQNDARWLKHFIEPRRRQQVYYLPHPVLRTVVRTVLGAGVKAKPRLIFGGDLSRKYVGDFFETLDHAAIAAILRTVGCEVLVIGKGNRPVYEAIAPHLPTRYETWVEDYATLCDPLRDVHAMPLLAGAGTKNRTLTALAMNVVVLSTPIGLENIDAGVQQASTIHRFRSGLDFPLALTAALQDLRARRLAGSSPPPPPITRITDAFRASTRHLGECVAAAPPSSRPKT
jgi:hypothetical protein